MGAVPIGQKPISPCTSHHGPPMSLVLQVSDLDLPSPPVYGVWHLSEFPPDILRLGTAFLRVRFHPNLGLFLCSPPQISESSAAFTSSPDAPQSLIRLIHELFSH